MLPNCSVARGQFMVVSLRGRDARVMVVCGLGYWIAVDGGVMNGKSTYAKA